MSPSEKPLTPLQTRIIHVLWIKSAQHPRMGLTYQDLRVHPGIPIGVPKPTMAMLKKTIRQLKGMSLVTSHPDSSKIYPKGRRPEIFTINTNGLTTDLWLGAYLVIIQDQCGPYGSVHYGQAQSAIARILPFSKNSHEASFIEQVNEAFELGYLSAPIKPPESEYLLPTPKLYTHLPFLRILYETLNVLDNTYIPRYSAEVEQP